MCACVQGSLVFQNLLNRIIVEENYPRQGGDSNGTEVIQNRLTSANMKKCTC